LRDGIEDAWRQQQRQVAEILEDAVLAGGGDRRRLGRLDDGVGARPDRGEGDVLAAGERAELGVERAVLQGLARRREERAEAAMTVPRWGEAMVTRRPIILSPPRRSM